MKIKLINQGQTGTLLLDGKLDAVTAPDAEKIFLEVADRFDNVVLDFKNLQYISSAGLRILKLLYMAVKKKDGILALKNVNKMCMEVFEMTGFAGILTFI